MEHVVEEEVVHPTKLTAPQQVAHKNVESTAVQGKQLVARVLIRTLPFLKYKDLRQQNPYLIACNPRVWDSKFHSKTQEDIYYDIYLSVKKPSVIV
jgi:hypothetical protein